MCRLLQVQLCVEEVDMWTFIVVGAVATIVVELAIVGICAITDAIRESW